MGNTSWPKPPSFVELFDTLQDFDPDGCSITLDMDIEELINQDFNDYTTVLPDEISPVSGTGLVQRRPATSKNF